jgi:exonuclease VII small subunit
MSDGIEPLVRELEEVAGRLRSGEIAGEEAAALVERCAELAARIGSELDAQARDASQSEGQERLL